MRLRTRLAIGVGVFAVAVVSQLPATLMDAGLRQASNGRVRIAEAQGTLWRGEGWIEFRDPAQKNAIARSIRWHFLPATLWRGRVTCEVRLEGTTRAFPIEISRSAVIIGDLEIELPATTLAFAEPRLKPLRLSGNVRLRTSGLSVGGQEMRGNVLLEWRAAGSALSPVAPLGSYELRLEGQGRSIQAKLGTLEGPVQLEGAGAWTIGARPALQATVRVPPENREALTPLLRLISVQRGEGVFELRPG